MSSISIQLPVETYQEISLYRNVLLEAMYEAERNACTLPQQYRLALLELIIAINQAQDTLFAQGDNQALSAKG